MRRKNLEIKVLKKADANLQKLAESTYVSMTSKHLLPENITKEAILHTISERITKQSHDSIFCAESNGEIVGWLAFYRISDSKLAQIWNWHPTVFPNENENEIATELIQEAFSHLRKIGLHEVTVDFPKVDKNTHSLFNKYLDWYSQTGITKIIEEKFYKKSITEEDHETSFPDEYSLGYISETELDDLFNCWIKIFSSSNDQYFLSLDAEGRRDFFFNNWSREKPLIKEASLTLSHKGKLIGFSRLLPIYEPTDGCLAGMGILPGYRRKGLAQKLLKMSMMKLKKSNYKTISFFVSTSNLAAISFYEKLGFQSQYKIASLVGEV